MFELSNPAYQKNNVTINRDQLQAILKTLNSSNSFQIQQVSLGSVGIVVDGEPVVFNRYGFASNDEPTN